MDKPQILPVVKQIGAIRREFFKPKYHRLHNRAVTQYNVEMTLHFRNIRIAISDHLLNEDE